MIDPEEMIEVSEEQFQSNFDTYMEQIENHGAYYLIRRSDGTAVVAAPITEEIEPLLDIMPEMPYDDGVAEDPSY
ncbi:PhDYefM tox-ant domain protein [Synechococcus phage S-CAM3]|uniref:PhDYefM tox-ant domain protein n=2 Tax=Synechococcus phage S-CAM3 TaxID=1883366 RepID=A0A1D8KJB4_9CAUD|nr:PhDYefM tox-ant domain protein [Synechococcus phage S-CAM3]